MMRILILDPQYNIIPPNHYMAERNFPDLQSQMAAVLALRGTDQLFSPEQKQLTEKEKFQVIFRSIYHTVNNDAVSQFIPDHAGINGKERTEFLASAGPLYESPILEGKQAEEKELLIDMITACAIDLYKKDESFHTDQKFRGDLAYHLQMLYWRELQKQDVTPRDLSNMKADVDVEERQKGAINPIQSRLRDTLEQVVGQHIQGKDQTEKRQVIFDSIAQLTNLDPQCMWTLLYFQPVDPETAEIMFDFYQQWTSRPEFVRETYRLHFKGLQKLIDLGADVDFIYQLNNIPVGNELYEHARIWMDPDKDLKANVDPQLNYYQVFQSALRDKPVALHQLESPMESTTRGNDIVAAVKKGFPLNGLLGNILHANPYYGAARAWEENLYLANGNTLNVAIVDFWKIPSLKIAISAGHEYMHMMVRRLLNGAVISQEELIADTAGQIMASNLKDQLDPSDKDPTRNLYRLVVGKHRQRAYGLVVYETMKEMEQAIKNRTAVDISDEDSDRLAKDAGRSAHQWYGNIFGNPGFFGDFSNGQPFVLPPYLWLCDGLCYVQFSDEKGETGKQIDYYKILQDRISNEGLNYNQAMKILLAGVIVNGADAKDLNRFSQYIGKATPEQAEAILEPFRQIPA